jgi:hypothetical protein
MKSGTSVRCLPQYLSCPIAYLWGTHTLNLLWCCLGVLQGNSGNLIKMAESYLFLWKENRFKFIIAFLLMFNLVSSENLHLIIYKYLVFLLLCWQKVSPDYLYWIQPKTAACTKNLYRLYNMYKCADHRHDVVWMWTAPLVLTCCIFIPSWWSCFGTS